MAWRCGLSPLGAPDLLVDLHAGELGPVGARISDGEDRIPTYLHGFTATCGVLVDTGSGGEAGGADDADDASGDESGEA